jgi:DNA-directed RNA polymerase specialized sigma24 family protein
MSADFSPRELIRRCSEGDRTGWEEFWGLVEQRVMGVFRRLLWSRRLDPSLADDLLQEFCLHLMAGGGARLRSFRGSSVGEFRAFMGTVARRFAEHRLLSWRRACRREAEALHALLVTPYSGPAESEYLFAWAQMVSLMAEHDRTRLTVLMAAGYLPSVAGLLAGSATLVRSPKTHGRWCDDLCRLYGFGVV